jgi:hypothetical protein
MDIAADLDFAVMPVTGISRPVFIDASGGSLNSSAARQREKETEHDLGFQYSCLHTGL